VTGNMLALIVATSVLVLIPGPNVALIVATSLRNGLRLGLITAAGTTVGIGIQLFTVIAGMAALIDLAASALTWIKWLGVAYLIYAGIRSWREPADDLRQVPAQSGHGVFWRAVLIAVVNPKTLLFNAAFLPQFVSGSGDATGQLMLVTGVYLVVIVIGDGLWALFAASARRFLGRLGPLRQRITGGFLVAGGLGLALTRRVP
jgi:threonine/homoserine/homoserine lactone efflux protein